MNIPEPADTSVARDHTGLVVLGLDECLARLAATPIGRLAFRIDGGITILPVAHVVHGAEVYFRTAGASKIEAALDCEEVAFEVDGYDATERSGWSVVVQGPAVEVLDESRVQVLEELADSPWVDLPDQGTAWIQIRAESISGRELPARNQGNRNPL
jgi:nitroimidazol reductase NimA-like FMN-containing flavoprotein (pyridoxamine 5'-phosphate oxidase superfamily)